MIEIVEKLWIIFMKISTKIDLTKEFYSGLGLSKLVPCLATVLSVLSLLNGDYSNRCVSVLVGSCEMWYAVVLIVRQLYVILEPNDCRRWVGLNVAFQVHIVLQSLSKTWSRCCDNWCKFDFNVYVTAGSTSNSILGNAVISSTVFLVNGCDLQYVTAAKMKKRILEWNEVQFCLLQKKLLLPINWSTSWQNCVILPAPCYSRWRETVCVASQFNGLSLAHHKRSGWVVADNRRSSNL